MTYLILSIISILIGPLILSLFPHSRRLDNFLFSFVLISVGGILLTELLPSLWQKMGLMLIPTVALGFFGPGLVEVSFRKAADKAHKFALLLGIFGLILHSALDGMAVVQQQNTQMLSYAVIIHRLIVGLSIWWLVEPIWGKSKSYLVFALLIASTVVGFYMATAMIGEDWINSDQTWTLYFQAIVAGTLLHVIIHRPHIDDEGHHHDHASAIEDDPDHSHSHGIVIKHMGYFSLGAVAAILLLILIYHYH
ncbi:hypothetical protein [Kangiella sp. HZ709]|uniref:hypothetical protein n=1 Tax=Kangiella sp. HZ709 TaxID=2666328 RepID=UPI0018A21143|nr:hypothetical protein [Kangiella sp. HZ709]